MIAATVICAALAAGRFDLSDEKACQAEIAAWLASRMPSLTVSREHRLGPRDIPDFMIDGVAVEIKMNSAQPRAVLAQLARYARHREVTAVVLATNRAMVLPATIEGKPLYGVSLGRAWL